MKMEVFIVPVNKATPWLMDSAKVYNYIDININVIVR